MLDKPTVALAVDNLLEGTPRKKAKSLGNKFTYMRKDTRAWVRTLGHFISGQSYEIFVKKPSETLRHIPMSDMSTRV